MNSEKLVLLTKEENYFVEYLLGKLILTDSISEAMVFDDKETAHKFKVMLYRNCNIECSVNTYINVTQ